MLSTTIYLQLKVKNWVKLNFIYYIKLEFSRRALKSKNTVLYKFDNLDETLKKDGSIYRMKNIENFILITLF